MANESKLIIDLIGKLYSKKINKEVKEVKKDLEVDE